MAHPTRTQRPLDALSGSSARATSWLGEALGQVRSTVLPPSHPQNRVAHRSGSRWQSRLAVVIPRIMLGTAALLFVVAVGLFAFRAMYTDRIYPAVIVGDVPVGGLTIEQAEDRVADRVADLEQGTVTFAYGGQVWSPTLAELGASVELDASVAEARALGREDDAVSRLGFTGNILQEDQVVPLRTTVNQQVLGAWFDRVDRELGKPAVNATVVVEGTSVSVTPDADGTVVDRDTATSVILGALTSLQPVEQDLPTVVAEPELRVADLEPIKSDVQRALSEPVRVDFENRSWRIEPETLSGFLTVSTAIEDGEARGTLELDQRDLAAYLREQFTGEINRKPADARVAWSDTEGLIALDASTDGITLKAPDFASAVTESFLGDHERIDIPVVVTSPEIDSNNLEALRIQTRLARGDSNYEGGTEPRDTNINVGVGLLNGTLVPPGEQFSFNGAIGEITADKGYVEAAVVIAERSGKGIGGGICQLSTTVFRAALLSGMPIEEWWPHTYRIQGYERDGWGPGFDASILQLGDDPSQWGDFKFTNTTGGWLLVESWTSYPHVIVNIYGEEPSYTVELEDEYVSEPITDNDDIEVVNPDVPAGTMQQIESPLDGLEAWFIRRIYDADGNMVGERQFYTYFKGRGNVYEVSPDMEGQSPASQ